MGAKRRQESSNKRISDTTTGFFFLTGQKGSFFLFLRACNPSFHNSERKKEKKECFFRGFKGFKDTYLQQIVPFSLYNCYFHWDVMDKNNISTWGDVDAVSVFLQSPYFLLQLTLHGVKQQQLLTLEDRRLKKEKQKNMGLASWSYLLARLDCVLTSQCWHAAWISHSYLFFTDSRHSSL